MAVKSSILVGFAFPTALPPCIWTMMTMMMHEVINFSYPPNSAATQNTALVGTSRLQKRLSANPNWLRQPLFLRLPPQVDKRPHLHFWTVNRGEGSLSGPGKESIEKRRKKIPNHGGNHGGSGLRLRCAGLADILPNCDSNEVKAV